MSSSIVVENNYSIMERKTQVVSCDGSVDGREFIVVSDHKAFRSYDFPCTNCAGLGTGYSNVQLLP